MSASFFFFFNCLYWWSLESKLTVSLNTRKNAQTGQCQRMTLYANDMQPQICPIRAFLRVVCLYQHSVDKCGPMFLTVNKKGQIERDKRLVSLLFLFSLKFYWIHFRRLRTSMRWCRRTFKISLTRTGLHTALTPFVVVVVNFVSRGVHGLLIWLLPGEAGLSRRRWQCIVISTLLRTTMNLWKAMISLACHLQSVCVGFNSPVLYILIFWFQMIALS